MSTVQVSPVRPLTLRRALRVMLVTFGGVTGLLLILVLVAILLLKVEVEAGSEDELALVLVSFVVAAGLLAATGVALRFTRAVNAQSAALFHGSNFVPQLANRALFRGHSIPADQEDRVVLRRYAEMQLVSVPLGTATYLALCGAMIAPQLSSALILPGPPLLMSLRVGLIALLVAALIAQVIIHVVNIRRVHRYLAAHPA